MDARSFNSQLAARLGIPAKDTAALSDRLVTAMKQCLSDLDNVAIPGFGTFSSMKTDEHIESDPDRGTTMLMPPSINIEFAAGSQLRKNVTPKKR